MTRELVDRIAPPLYGAVVFMVIVGPAVAVKVASDRGGMGDMEGVDLVVASTALGLVQAFLAATRLRSEEVVAVRRADMWIASLDALVVLTLAATLLPLVVLWGFADEHGSLADRGYPVVALWAGLQFVAVTLSESTGRFVFWWLEPHPRRVRFDFRRHL